MRLWPMRRRPSADSTLEPKTTTTPRSRRDLLRSILGTGVGVVAGAAAYPRSVDGADGDGLVLGTTANASGHTTGLSVGGNAATIGLAVSATDMTSQTIALQGVSHGSAGVVGASIGGIVGQVGVYGIGPTGVMGAMGSPAAPGTGQWAGVYGEGLPSQSPPGVLGRGFYGPGVMGQGTNAVGVVGKSDSSAAPAVYGWSLYQTGVYGFVGAQAPGDLAPGLTGGIEGVRGIDGGQSSSGRGVYGFSTVGAGVVAEAGPTATALRVIGKASFSRSGRVAVSAGHSSVSKTLAGVTTSSLVIAVLQTHRSGVSVAAAVPAAGKFTVYLSKAVTATTYVAYLVLN